MAVQELSREIYQRARPLGAPPSREPMRHIGEAVAVFDRGMAKRQPNPLWDTTVRWFEHAFGFPFREFNRTEREAVRDEYRRTKRQAVKLQTQESGSKVELPRVDPWSPAPGFGGK